MGQTDIVRLREVMPWEHNIVCVVVYLPKPRNSSNLTVKKIRVIANRETGPNSSNVAVSWKPTGALPQNWQGRTKGFAVLLKNDKLFKKKKF